MFVETRIFSIRLLASIKINKWKWSFALLVTQLFIWYKQINLNVPKTPNYTPCELKTRLRMESLPKNNFTYSFESSKNYKGPVVKGWEPSVNRNISHYIPKDKESFLVLPRNVSLTSTELLIIIRTRVDGLKQRNFIRVSLGKHLQKFNPDSKIIFVIGKSNEKPYHYLDKEIEDFGDILQADFIDSYLNLTLKTISLYKYVLHTKWINRPKMIVSMDDDMFINVPLLIEELKRFGTECKGPYLMGSLVSIYSPITDPPDAKYSSKWSVPSYMLSKGVYPSYIQGCLTLMSYETVECIYEEVFHLPYFHIEDIITTGFSAKRCGITPEKSKYLVITNTTKTIDFNFTQHLALLTNSYAHHKLMYEKLLNNSNTKV